MKISMFDDRIEIVSPGGLPEGISKEEYLNSHISSLRNPILANLFFRFRYIEMFGTGIERIIESYKNKPVNPAFEVYENSVKVILPVVTGKREMTSDEDIVYKCLTTGSRLSSSELAERTYFSKNKVIRLLNSLSQKNYIKVFGTGRGTKYGI